MLICSFTMSTIRKIISRVYLEMRRRYSFLSPSQALSGTRGLLTCLAWSDSGVSAQAPEEFSTVDLPEEGSVALPSCDHTLYVVIRTFIA